MRKVCSQRASKFLGLCCRGHGVILVAACFGAGCLGLAPGGPTRNKSLREELTERSAHEGLALVRVRNNWMQVHSFDVGPTTIRNPRFSSIASFSGNGRYVGWRLVDPTYQKALIGPFPVIIESLDGSYSWQLPGHVLGVGVLDVSFDGRRAVFSGVWQPTDVSKDGGRIQGIGAVQREAAGIYYADSERNVVTRITGLADQPNDVSSISWSPDGKAFVYDSQGRIYIYIFATASRRFIAEGLAPAWSPDGTRIAFTSAQNTAVVMDLKTNKTKVLLNGDKIEWAVHWSPDSRYVMVSQLRSIILDLLENPFEDRTFKLAIYRIDDGATVSDDIRTSGVDDTGFYWVTDYRAFLKGASVPPKIRLDEDSAGVVVVPKVNRR